MTTRQAVYAATTALAVLAFAGSGLANLLHLEHIAHDMTHLGYPPYVMTVLGTWKLLGAVVVAAPQLPRVKEWAYAGMIFDLTGAAASRAASGDGALTVLIPLLIAVAVTVSWATRPATRRLSAPSVRRLEPRAEAT
ncbi:MAG TPA: DoxX family protein [Polyangiaceae bacterium]|nr:DoxX family protein [Polyangiaceae bacterium]